MPEAEHSRGSDRPEDDQLLLFGRLLQRFSEHARALDRLERLVVAQAAELSRLNEQNLSQAERIARLEANLAQVTQAAELMVSSADLSLSARRLTAVPWWMFWRR